jgi:hypothetical protein
VESTPFGVNNYFSWTLARADGITGNWTDDFGGGAYTDDGRVFLPLAGYREQSGRFNIGHPIELRAVGDIGGTPEFLTGNYWTSSFSMIPEAGNNMFFEKERPMSVAQSSAKNGYPVRCVRPAMVNAVHAAPGVPGIKKSDYMALLNGTKSVGDGSYTLTIKGSSAFRNTWAETMARGSEFTGRGIYGGLEKEPVYAVYFKWGSLVAMIGGSSWKADGSNVVWVNPGYAGPVKGAYGSGTPFSPAATQGVPGSGNNVVENLAKGHGDPCRFVNGGTLRWMTPTGNPWTSPVATYGGSGTPFGTGGTAVAFGTGDVVAVSGRKSSTPPGLNYLGSLSLSAVTTDRKMFLPAAGYYRADPVSNTYGLLVNTAATGMYWTSTAMDGDNGTHLSFNGVTATGAASSNMNSGFSVRCVPAP